MIILDDAATFNLSLLLFYITICSIADFLVISCSSLVVYCSTNEVQNILLIILL